MEIKSTLVFVVPDDQGSYKIFREQQLDRNGKPIPKRIMYGVYIYDNSDEPIGYFNHFRTEKEAREFFK